MDPFTTLHAGIESLLRSSPCMKEAVGPGLQDRNFIAFTKNKSDNQIDATDNASLPRIVLQPAGGPTGINTASNFVTLTYTLNVLIGTGDMRANILHPVLWAVFATLASAQSRSALTALTWSDRPFVKAVAVLSMPVGLPSQEITPGASGWSSICAVTFSLGFHKPEIDAFVAGE